MSQPSGQLTPPPAPLRGNPLARPRNRFRRPLFWIVIFGFLIPFGVAQVPREIGRRHLAAAYQLREKGQADKAYKELEATANWFPNSPELLLQRAEWKLEDGKKEQAIADCEAMLAAGGESVLWRLVHGTFLQHAGEFGDAVADWKKLQQTSLRSGTPDRATALNGLAYAQALANVELDEALIDVNEALDLERGSYNVLDTRGLIHFLRKDYEAALADLDLAVVGCDKAVELADANARQHSTPPFFHKVVSARPKRLLEIAPPDEQSQRKSIATAAAVVHYHRSLVFDALDRKDDAKKDWEIARQLSGREPDETLF